MSRMLEIRTPHGRYIRQPHKSVRDARAILQTGYDPIGEVLDPRPDGSGGYTVYPPLPDFLPSHNLLTMLLYKHGDDLRTWLKNKP